MALLQRTKWRSVIDFARVDADFWQRRLPRFILAIWGLRLSVLALRAFFPFDYPHIHRQVDTMGVALRYWIRWTQETQPKAPILPALLSRGDYYAIQAMEFPLINWLTAPFFALDLEWARALAHLFLVAAVFGLSFVNARVWRGQRICGVDAYPVMLMLPIFSFALEYSGRFMPDYLAFILVVLAVGLSWEKRRWWASAAVATLGLWIKPSAAIALAPLLLKPPRVFVKEVFTWVAASLALTLGYYIFVVRFINSFSDQPPYFAIVFRDPVTSFLAFFARPDKLMKMMTMDAFLPGGWIVLLVATAVGFATTKRLGRERALTWGLLALQIAAIAALGGETMYTHDYYFVGMTVICALLVAATLAETRATWLSAVFLLLILGRSVELSAYDVRPLIQPNARMRIYRECSTLRARNPQWPWKSAYVFRNSPERYPALGLCFGEAVGSNRAKHGFFYKRDSLPADCRSVDETENLVLAECGE